MTIPNRQVRSGKRGGDDGAQCRIQRENTEDEIIKEPEKYF